MHHTVGPHSNTKSTLKWVTPSENNKARRFFTDDGQRKSKRAKKTKVVEKRVLSTNQPEFSPQKPNKDTPLPKQEKLVPAKETSNKVVEA